MKTSADFKKLPADIQNRLIDLRSGNDGAFVFSYRASIVSLVPFVLLIGWLAYGYSASQQARWEPWMFWLILVITTIAFPVAFLGLWRFIGPKISKLKGGHVVTQHEYLKISGREVSCIPLKEIEALRFLEDDKQIELWSGTHEERISVQNFEDAQRLDVEFDRMKSGAVGELSSTLSEPKYAYSRGSAGTLTIVGIAATSLIGASVAFGFNSLNLRHFENVAWEQAKTAGSVEAIDGFRAQFPNGYFAAEADQAMQSIVAKVKEKYLAKLKNGANQESVAAFGTFLESVAKRPDRMVYVKISETREVDTTIVPALEEQYGVTVSSYETSVPVASQPRKEKVFADLKLLLSSATERGMLNAELVDSVPAGAPSIDIKITIRPVRSMYRMTNFANGRYFTNNHPGASFLFDVALANGDASTPFKMQYFGQAMQVNTGVFDSRDRDNFSFDKMLFLTVMNGFDKNFETTFGLAENSVPGVQ